MFDPSARPRVELNILSLAIRMSRFLKLYYTINSSCLKGMHAWEKIKKQDDKWNLD